MCRDRLAQTLPLIDAPCCCVPLKLRRREKRGVGIFNVSVNSNWLHGAGLVVRWLAGAFGERRVGFAISKWKVNVT
jgi:hypothetical protein